jgi:hypothetical protein
LLIAPIGTVPLTGGAAWGLAGLIVPFLIANPRLGVPAAWRAPRDARTWIWAHSACLLLALGCAVSVGLDGGTHSQMLVSLILGPFAVSGVIAARVATPMTTTGVDLVQAADAVRLASRRR